MKTYTLFICLSALIVSFLMPHHAPTQTPPMRTANYYVPPYKGHFGFGSNMGYYPPHSDTDIADFAAKIGVNTLRPALFEHFLETYGYDIRLDAFEHYADLGMRDNVCFIGYPSAEHRDKKVYGGKDTSVLFANLYEPIWDNGENDTPVNDRNFYALYVYKTVKKYGKYVKFWEIWNEPDFGTTYKTEMAAGLPGAWWNTNPEPAEYALHAPVQHYIRMLRISYEVIKNIDSSSYVAVGGIGFPSFLDILLRQTDNPDNGKLTPQYPLNGGAYFDVVSYHSYPHIDNSVREWSDKISGFTYSRHSDKAVEGVFNRQKALKNVLDKYGYDGIRYPKKHYIITETNIPAREKDEFMGSYTAQRNFLLKTIVKAQVNGILQCHPYSIAELKTETTMRNEFDMMGLFNMIEHVDKNQVTVNSSGIAYHTASILLKEYAYDSVETRRLNLPFPVDGAAFRHISTQNKVIYCLWAKTMLDRSEETSAVYTFPTPLSKKPFERLEWDFSTTKTSKIINYNNVKLTGTPSFFTVKN